MKAEAAGAAASRRAFLHAGLASAFGLAAPLCAPAQTSWIGQFANSRDRAFAFLNFMMDAYATGPVARLIQSYSDQTFPDHPSVAFTYDSAVVLLAYLARGRPSDVRRAEILGNGLLAAQSINSPVADGRFSQAYYVNAANSSSGAHVMPANDFRSSSVGDQAWAGMGLAQLYHATMKAEYLKGAVRVANWIVENAYSTVGAGGYGFGATIDSQKRSIPSTNGKSTEHNIDIYAFFQMLDTLMGGAKAANGQSWSTLASHALQFVQAMFNAKAGFFYTGTDSDQATIAKGNIPEDVQTWSYLALQDASYGRSIDWALSHLIATDKLAGNFKISGATFASDSLTSVSGHPHAVWLEGTAHLAAAVMSRRFSSDRAGSLFENIRRAQQKLGAGQRVNRRTIPAHTGIPASTSVLDTGFGFKYSPDLHIGATGWYLLALLGANPFQLGFRLLQFRHRPSLGPTR